MQFLIPAIQGANLSRWEGLPISPGVALGPQPGDDLDEHVRVVAIERPGPPQADGPFRRVADAVFRYEVFPPSVVTGVVRRRPVDVADTVGIRYRCFLVSDLFFACRVVDRFDGPNGDRWRAGFRYQTLVGHPEVGEETFAVTKDLTTGAVEVSLRAWSRPGHWLARLFAPLVRRCQLHAARSALRHLASVAAGQVTPGARLRPAVESRRAAG